MYTGSIPTTSIHGTWSENAEIWSVDDDTLMDLTGLIEVTLRLRNPITRYDDLVLTMSNGDITLPSTGIIQWRVEAITMASIPPGPYEIILQLEDSTDTVPLILGTISIVE